MKYNQKVVSTLLYKSIKVLIGMKQEDIEKIPIEMRNKLDEIVNEIILNIIRADIEIKRSEEIEDFERCKLIMDSVDIYIKEKVEQICSIKPGVNKKKIFEKMKESQKFIRENC